MRERKFRLLLDGKLVGYETHRLGGRNVVIGQDFTGFTDTDGVEIYEGDVVEVPSKRGGSLHGTVVWLEKGGAWVVHFCLIQTDDWYMPLCDAVPKGCRVVKEGE